MLTSPLILPGPPTRLAQRLNKQVAANVKAFLEGNPINVVNK